MNYFSLDLQDFKIGYNYNIMPYVRNLGYQNLDYISWADCYLILKKLFPHLTVGCELNKDNQPYWYLENHTSGTEIVTELLSNKLLNLKNEIENVKYDKNVNSTEKKKQLKTLNNAVTRLETELYYNTTGMCLRPYLLDTTTGNRTFPILFPVMDNNNNSIVNPDSRDLNDNMMRCYVKCVATYTGIGLRLFTREGIDANPLDPSDKQRSRIADLLEQVGVLINSYKSNISSILPDGVFEPDFSHSVKDIEFVIDKLEGVLDDQEDVNLKNSIKKSSNVKSVNDDFDLLGV